jgi:hypothetical protein
MADAQDRVREAIALRADLVSVGRRRTEKMWDKWTGIIQWPAARPVGC